MGDSPCVVGIESDADIVSARQVGRQLASEAGFSASDQTVIATAISELARNILKYAGKGIITVELEDEASGLKIVAQDNGPGIADIELALRDGYSTSNSLGLGLPGTRRLMDEFSIVSEPGRGTLITVRKWTR